jgi:hypothetical protein
LHPAYIAGVAWALLLRIAPLSLVPNPAWKALTLRLVGH